VLILRDALRKANDFLRNIYWRKGSIQWTKGRDDKPHSFRTVGPSGYALFTVAAALLVPLLPMAAGLIPGSITGLRRARLAHRFALVSFVTALVVAGLVTAYGPAFSSLSTAPWQPLSVQVDALTVVMLLLVSFLGRW